MLRRPHYIALGAVVILTLTILNLPTNAATRLKQAVGTLFLPLIGLSSSTQQAAQRAGDAVASRGELLRENEALHRENQELRLLQTQSKETERENERLRKQVGWLPQKKWKLRLARIALRDPANWWRTLQIDLGSRNGLRVNMPVLTADGLVGRISSVSLDRAQVVLLGDPNCRVSARVENETRDTGVVGPGGPLESFVEMGYLLPTANVKSGQNVLTSGIGGIFPAGITIGKIVDSRSADYGLSTVARIKLAVNLNALEEVWVMIEP